VVSEADMLEAIYFGHEAMQPIIDLQEKLKSVAGVPKHPFLPLEKDPTLVARIESELRGQIETAVIIPEKTTRSKALREVKDNYFALLGEAYADRRGEIYEIIGELQKSVCRDLILNTKVASTDGPSTRSAPFSARPASCPGPTAARFSPGGKPRCWPP
jgi:polyribonucleotide nucleotidyltransferase